MDDSQRIKIKGARRFIIFTSPHLADPSWKIPIIEMVDPEVQGEPAKPVEYYNTDVLEHVVRNLVSDRQRAEGYNAGANHVLETFGLTLEAYYGRLKENKAAKEK
jgi:hypothetical protein